MQQDVRFCRTSDGIRIAYAVTGSGYPLVWIPGWVSHLELDWEWEATRASFERLSRDFMLVRFDKRGTGLSQRGVTDYSPQARCRDVEAVVASAGLERVALCGISEGCIAAMQFASDHPDQVSHLVLQGVAAPNPQTQQLLSGVVSVIKAEWGLGSTFMSDVFLPPDASAELRAGFVRYQREGATAEDAAAMMAANIAPRSDGAQMLARITSQTLLINGRSDNVAPPEAGRRLAARMGARYMSRDGAHIANEEQRAVCEAAIVDFVLGRHADEAKPSAAAVQAPKTGAPVTILFTDMESSTATTQRLGDAAAQDLVRAHNTVVRDALKQHEGNEIKHTGDGIMASFAAASNAVECAMAIQRGLAERTDTPRVRIGINAGEPVAEEDDLFGTAVQLAARVCAHAAPGQIVASNVVRELTAGKKFLFADIGDIELRGFEDPVRLYELRWQP
jgi:class 3 adenylate cyclase